MGDYLRKQGVNLTIYVAGGAVNTIYLRSRHSTGDVDFFGANDQSRLLKEASKYAQQHSKSQLGANWFNNSMSLFLSRPLEQDLICAYTTRILFSSTVSDSRSMLSPGNMHYAAKQTGSQSPTSVPTTLQMQSPISVSVSKQTVNGQSKCNNLRPGRGNMTKPSPRLC